MTDYAILLSIFAEYATDTLSSTKHFAQCLVVFMAFGIPVFAIVVVASCESTASTANVVGVGGKGLAKKIGGAGVATGISC